MVKRCLLVPTRLAPSPIHGLGVFAVGADREGHAGVALREGPRHGVRRPDIVETLPAARADVLRALRLSRPQREADHPVLRRRALRQSLAIRPNVATDYAQDSYGARRRVARHRGGRGAARWIMRGFEESAGGDLHSGLARGNIGGVRAVDDRGAVALGMTAEGRLGVAPAAVDRTAPAGGESESKRRLRHLHVQVPEHRVLRLVVHLGLELVLVLQRDAPWRRPDAR